MPSPLDYISTFAPSAVNAIFQRRASGNATRRLTGGVGRARDIATTRAQQLQALYDKNHAEQQGMLDPYRQAGTQNLNTIQAGLGPGGEFKPFTQDDLKEDAGYQFTLQEGNKALDAARRALGTKMSGGAVKEGIAYNTGMANTHFNDAFERDRQTQTDRYNRLKGIVDVGFDANTQAVNSSQNYANESGQAQLLTSQQLQDMEMQQAEAEAAGDIGKADAIGDAIQAGMAGLQGLKEVGAIDKLTGAVKNNGSTLAGLTVGGSALGAGAGPALGGLALGGATPAAMGAGSYGLAALPGLGAGTGAAPTGAFASMIAGGAGTTGAGAAGAGTTAAAAPGGGAMSAITGFLSSNPWTIPVAAGIIGATAWIKSQAHHEASSWVDGFQNKFDAKMDGINRQFQTAAKSGQLTKEQGTAMRAAVQELLGEYEAQRQAFAKKGKDEKKVAGQALTTFNRYYGANGSDFLGKLDQTIAQLPG